MKSTPEQTASAVGPDAERLSELVLTALHCMVFCSAPGLLANRDIVDERSLALWMAAEGVLAVLSLVAFTLIGRGNIRRFVQLSSITGVGSAITFSFLPWLGDGMASGTPYKHLMMISLVAVTSVAAINSQHITRRRAYFLPLLVVVSVSYILAYLTQREFVFAAISAIWCVSIVLLTQVGHRGMAELLELRKHSERLARHDGLTGLLSRTAFFDELRQKLANPDVNNAHTALVLFDLDGFKAVNDSFGHPAGDTVLRAVAKRLELFLPTGAVVGRLGGDEFAAIFPVGDYLLDPAIEATLEAVSDPIGVDGRELYVAASAGWTLLDDASTVADLIAQADAALYQSKSSSTSMSIGFDADLRQELDRSLDIRQRFRSALKRHEIEFVSQPLVRTSDGAPVAVELLARWPQLDSSIIGPTEFTRAADETGLAVELDQQALMAACELLERWHEDPALSKLVVKANVSPVHLHNNELIESVRKIVPPHLRRRLGLEMNESRLIRAAERNHLQLQALIDMGITLSIDDFGVGYSSLAYLRTLPISEIKIDRSFVTNLDSDRINQGLMRAIVDIASTLGLPTVAEGIENEAELEAVTRLGVSTAQGFVVGHPLPLAETEAELRRMHEAATTLQP